MVESFFNVLADESGDKLAEAITTAAAAHVTGPLAIPMQIVTNTLGKWVFKNVCSELRQRHTTDRQQQKMGVMAQSSIEAFCYLASQVNEHLPVQQQEVTDEWVRKAYEITENIFLKSANETQTKKLNVVGYFFGKVMFDNVCDWDSIYFLTNLFSNLSYRQVIMIKLLVEYVPPRPQEKKEIPKSFAFRSNATYMEFQQLLSHGMFEVGQGSTGWATIDLSGNDFSSDIHSTELATEFYERFMLYMIEDRDVDEVIGTF